MYIYDTVLGFMLPWHKYEISYLFCLPFYFTVGPNSDRNIIFDKVSRIYLLLPSVRYDSVRSVRYDSGQNTLILLEYPYLIGVVYAGK